MKANQRRRVDAGSVATRSPGGFFYRVKALVAAAALAALVAGAFSSCNAGGGGATGAPCDTVYAGKCGGTCVNDSSCAAGLYCDPTGKCAADCAPGAAACPSGLTCTPEGRCKGEASGGTGGSDPFIDGGFTTSSGSGSGDACADVSVKIDKQIPTVVLLIDQSGSMTEAFPGGNRWDVLENALMSQASGVVKLLEKDVRFGFTLYSAKDADPVCPLLVNVPIALNNYDAINAAYSSAAPIEDTPTGESIQAVVKVLDPYPEPGPKIIVLATDGEPDTCAEKDPAPGSQGAIAAQQLSVKAAQEAYDKKIQTFVIAVGNQISQAHLQDVANAGAGKPIGGGDNAKYYQPTDQQALIDAFNEIINGVRTCVFTLNGKVDAASAGLGAVVLDGQSLGYNDPNGWKLNSESEIELVGAACDTIQSGEHDLTVKFPCGTVVIDPE
jgi:hypothetical protein